MPADLVPQIIHRRLAELAPAQTGVLLAVSGGSDSMGLMHLAAGAGEGAGLRLVVGFVDHGLRSGIDEEWDLVRRSAGELGIEARRLTAVPPGEEGARDSLQQWAREARYGLLLGLARSLGFGALATAHTRDDQAETVLLRLLRGAGIDGLAAIPPRREVDGIAVIRPLLDLDRARIRRWLEDRGVPWVEDPSNEDPRFERVRVRQELLPLLQGWHPGLVERLAVLAAECRETGEFFDGICEAGGSLRRLRLGGGAAADLSEMPAALRPRLVRALLRRVRGDLRGIDRVHVEGLVELAVRGASTAEIPLPGGAVAHVHDGTIFSFSAPLAPRPSGSGQPVASGPGAWKVRFSALGALAEIEAESGADVARLELRARRPGDRLFGSERRLKQILVEARVPRPYRNFVPVLAGPEGVVACPGILPCRQPGLAIRWMLDDNAPFLDVDFPMD